MYQLDNTDEVLVEMEAAGNKVRFATNIQRERKRVVDTIHLLHAGEGNMKIYSSKSIIFPEGSARGEYDTRG